MANIVKLNYTADEINERLGKVADAVQETGDSEIAVMSQKAVTNEIGKTTIVNEGGNFNNTEMVFGGYNNLNAGQPVSTFSSATIVRSSDIIPAIAGKTVYAIFEGITTSYMKLICYDADRLLLEHTNLYGKNMTQNMSVSTEYILPENTAFVAFYITNTTSTECRVGLYYTPYEATTVEEYSYGTRYLDGTKIMKDGKVIEVAEADHTHIASDVGAYTTEEVDALISSDLDSITLKKHFGNINNSEIESGGYNDAGVKFNSATITRSATSIPVVSGETIYTIIEGTTANYMTLFALDNDSTVIEKISTFYAKNKVVNPSFQTAYTIPDGCTSIVFHMNTNGSIDYRVGIYYDYYEATTVEDYVEPSRYLDASKMTKDGKLIDVAEADELNEVKNRLSLDNIVEADIPVINNSDVEYANHLMKAVRGEMANMWKYLGTKHEVTVLDSGVCGENLTWVLYSDGLLKISGTGRAYDYCKGLFGDKITREEIEAYQAQYEGLTDADSVAKYERGFQEGKIYDDEHGQYIAPWYKYRPEVSFVEDVGAEGYITKAEYDRDNPNGWTYNRIEIDEGITYLGNWMLYRICGATELVIPSTVTAIGQWCIRYSPSLKCIYLPDGITTIEKRGCSRHEVAEAIRLGEGFTTIGEYAFAQNPMVKSLHLKGDVTNMGANPFYGDHALETITLEGMTEINSFWFGECNNMTRVQLAEGLTSIATSAFVNRQNLVAINIPSTVTTIGQSAFYNCTNLKYLYIDSPTVAQGLVDIASTVNFGHVNYYAKYIYVKSDIENVGAWFENYCEKCADIDGYTLYVVK